MGSRMGRKNFYEMGHKKGSKVEKKTKDSGVGAITRQEWASRKEETDWKRAVFLP